jgi:hypothetical protein
MVVGIVVGGAFATVALTIAGIVLTVKSVWLAIKDFFKSMASNPTVKGAISTIRKKLGGAFKFVETVVNTVGKAVRFFMKQIEELGGFSFNNVIDAFTRTRDTFFNWFERKNPGFKKFREDFTEQIDKVKEAVATLGLDSEGLKSKWKAVSSFAVTVFTWVYDKIKDISGKVTKAVTGFFANKTVQNVIEKFKNGFVNLWNSLGPFFSGLVTAFSDFISKVNELGGFKFDNLGNIWEAFKATIGEHFKNFTGFDSLKDALASAWEAFKAWLEEHGIDVSGIEEKINNFVITVQGMLGELKVPEFISNLFKTLTTPEGADPNADVPIIKRIQTFIDNVVSAIISATEGFSIPDALSTFLGLFSSTKDELDKLSDPSGDKGSFLDVILGFMRDLSEIIKASPLENIVAMYSLIKTFTFIADIGSAAKNAAKAAKNATTDGTLLMRLKDVLWAVAAILAVVAYIGSNVEQSKLESTLLWLGGFLVVVTIAAGAIASFINFAAGSVGGAGGTKVTGSVSAKAMLFINLLKGFLDKAELAGLAVAASAAISNLASIPDFDGDKAIKAAEAISLLVGVITGVSSITNLFDKIGDKLGNKSYTSGMQVILDFVTNLLGAGLIGAASLAISELISLPEFDADKAYKGAEAIALIGGSIVGIAEAITIAGKAGLDAAAATKGMSAIGAVLAEGGVVAGLLGALTYFANEALADTDYDMTVEETIEHGFTLLGKIARGLGDILGQLVGGVIAGAGVSISGSLATIATNMVAFTEAIQPLGDGKHDLNDKKINDILEAVARITMQGLDTGVANWFVSGTTYGQVSDALVQTSNAVKEWERNLKDINQVTLPDGLGHLEDELKKISSTGLSLAFDDFKKFLTSGGVLNPFREKTSIETFTEAMTNIQTAITTWNTLFGSEEDSRLRFDSEGFEDIKTAIEGIPELGFDEVIKKIAGGETSAGQFGSDMTAIATGLKDFAGALGNPDDKAKIMLAISTVRTFGELADILEEANFAYFSNFGDIIGGNQEKYGGGKMTLAEGLNEFYKGITVDKSELSTLATTTKNLAYAVTTMSILNLDGSDLADGTLITDFATNINTLVDSITYTSFGNYSMVDQFVAAIERVAGANLQKAIDNAGKANAEAGGRTVGNAIATGMSESSKTASDAAVGVATDAAGAISGSESTSAFATSAGSIVDTIASTFNSTESYNKLDVAMRTLVSSMTSTLNENQFKFFETGTYLAEGFAAGVNGFRARLAVRGAAIAIGKIALDALKFSIDSNSPSKKAEKIGGFFDDGFVVGMKGKLSDIYDTSSEAGSLAVRGLRSSIRALNSMIEDGLDSTPVIRPVLDMTNIQNGSLALNSMIGGTVPVGIAGNLNAINANVNARNMTTMLIFSPR